MMEKTDFFVLTTAEKLTLTFKAAGQEGYLWHVTAADDQLDVKAVSTTSHPQLRGKEITTKFAVSAEQPGEYTITFALVPAWKRSDTPADTRQLTIRVK